MQVEIPFLDEWKEKMLHGNKCCTSRTKKYGNTGDTFTAFGAKWLLNIVRKNTLWHVANKMFALEGCGSPEEFIKVWNKLHPRKGYNPDQLVWVYIFEQLGGIDED